MPLAASAVLVGALLQAVPAVVAQNTTRDAARVEASGGRHAPQASPHEQSASANERSPRDAPGDQQEKEKPPTPVHTGIHALFSGYLEDLTHLPSLPNLYLTMAGGAAALSLHP